MAIITLTSDWGTSDYYVAAVKGRILSYLPNATIVDVTHNIEPFSIAQAGFTLKTVTKVFPKAPSISLALRPSNRMSSLMLW